MRNFFSAWARNGCREKPDMMRYPRRVHANALGLCSHHNGFKSLEASSRQVQPDMEELTENADEAADEAESKHSEVKLGKLQFKVRRRVANVTGIKYLTAVHS